MVLGAMNTPAVKEPRKLLLKTILLDDEVFSTWKQTVDMSLYKWPWMVAYICTVGKAEVWYTEHNM